MRVLFIHPNIPGQFRHLVGVLAGDARHQVAFITQRGDRKPPNVTTLVYRPARAAGAGVHPYLRAFETAVLHGQQVVRAIDVLRRNGFTPDIVVGHAGWGEMLFVKDLLPATPVVNYCEFFFPTRGVAVGPAPQPEPLDAQLQHRVENAPLLISLEAADQGWSPTYWQRDSYPALLRPKIEVVFDGIDLEEVRPCADAGFQLPCGRVLRRDQDEVVTFTARGLEPYRGFPQFVRALPEFLRRRPGAIVLIAGGEETYYGPPPAPDRSWREALLTEVELDPARVRFLGWLERPDYLTMLQVSRLHVHLTVPFVLSWSFFEALASGALVLASDTEPVREVLRDGDNGVLTPMHQPAQLAEAMAEALARRDADQLRRRGRETIARAYALTGCLPRQIAMLQRLVG